jgi:CubicO group peptidase (beta-lactamase class C family)
LKSWREVLFAAPVYATLVVSLASCGEASPRQHTTNGEAPSQGCTSAPAPELARAVEQIDRLLAGTVREQAIPGVAAGVVCGRDLAWAQGYGVMALDDPRPVTPRTRFRIASLTKLFTATAVMLLKDRGILGLSDPAARYVPWIETIARPEESGNRPITITHLLAHTSGLPRDSRLTDFRLLFQPAREEAIAAISSQELQARPGEANAYSNLGYAVLGEIIAEAAGTSYAQFLQQELFVPLGMAETLVHPTSEDDVAWGHGPRRPDGSRAKAGFWQLRFATPAGGMASSVEELSNFMILHLAPYSGAQPRLLSSSTLREMHDVHDMVDPERGGVGLGWAVEISNGQHLVYHGGELPEQTSFMLLDLRAGIGVVVLTNAQDADANGMAQEILRVVRGAVFDSATSFPAQSIPPG